MGGEGCVDGNATLYAIPIPWIGLYIAVATLVCFFCMFFDSVYGLFIRKNPFIPCKLFPMNAFTMTVIAIATKITGDLITSMPRAEDQLSKLTSTALLCTSLGFFMPSLGTMGTSERYGNLAALSILVITMVVNVCIQIGTGLIFAFTIEHIIIILCILVLLLLMWSSALAFRGQKWIFRSHYKSKILLEKETDNAKGVQGLRNLLVKLHVLNYTGNPQTLLCETIHHHSFGLLCTLSATVVLQAMVRSFILKSILRLCSSSDGVSEYKWSIPIIIVSQFLSIIVGTFSIIYRWLSFIRYSNGDDIIIAHKGGWFYPERELEYLKTILSFKFPIHGKSKRISKFFLVSKDFIMDVLIRTQGLLYTCNSFFIGYPIYTVKSFLEKIIIPFDWIFREHDHEHANDVIEEGTSSEIWDFVLSSQNSIDYDTWISKMAMKDMMRWTKAHKRNRLTHLIQLISECGPAASKSECDLFMRKLEATGKAFVEIYKMDVFEYRVSCVSVLVLSKMLAQLMPSSRRESLMHNLEEALNESFEIIYYVDQKTLPTPNLEDERRWTSAKEVWAQWDNPKHWFQTEIISQVFKSCSLKRSEESKLELDDVLGVLSDALPAEEEISKKFSYYFYGYSLAKKQMNLITIELSIICKFIREQNYKSVKDLFDFLELCFVKMLHFSLSRLPLAILKEIDEEYPSEIGEERTRKALKFLSKLELLADTKIEWSWPARFEPEIQANDVHSPLQADQTNQTSSTGTVVAPSCGSEIVATMVAPDRHVSVVAAAADADAAIGEIGSDEIV